MCIGIIKKTIKIFYAKFSWETEIVFGRTLLKYKCVIYIKYYILLNYS